MDELLWARLIFALGALVTGSTVVMIVRGHLDWRDRGAD
ncbi:putative membrane protein [Synechococcus sp. A18-25c]|nr:putative membrane protein [Synechococcus sp. A15-60]QNJ21274.1 putative membrane protein [Synechococcus sp. A18-25c]